MKLTDMDMGNQEAIVATKGTSPLLTIFFFGLLVAGIVTSGSYFSKQHMAAREVEDGIELPFKAFAASNR